MRLEGFKEAFHLLCTVIHNWILSVDVLSFVLIVFYSDSKLRLQ